MITHNFLGNTFKIGDFVTYPVRKGSSLWMSFGIVYKLETVHKYDYDMLRVGVIIVQFGQWRFPYDHNNLPFYDFAYNTFLRKVSVEPDRMVKLREEDIPSILVEKLKQAIK